ncbi:MAG: hypothetical protein AAF531_09415 [Actinomycetota bacterium]
MARIEPDGLGGASAAPAVRVSGAVVADGDRGHLGWPFRHLRARRLRRAADAVSSRRYPVASVGLYAMGQLLLTLAIAVGQVGPITGIVVCLIWMVCGLLLVLAQAVGQVGDSSSE